MVTIFTSFVDDVNGIRKLWLVGDNFMVSSFHTSFLRNVEASLYLRSEFQIEPFCSSRFNDNNKNLLSRIQVTLANAITKEKLLPQYIVMVLDDDLIQHLDFRNVGVSMMLGHWLEWVMAQVNDLIMTRKSALPSYAKEDIFPFVYWIELPKHCGFDSSENTVCTKFNNCLQTLVKQYPMMRIAKLKEVWKFDDHDLVIQNCITADGLVAYWRAIDKALQFNIQKHKEYLARIFLEKIKKQPLGSKKKT